MGRYISIFLTTILIILVLFFTLPLVIGGIAGEILFVVGIILVVLVSFVLTQLFYIIDLLKEQSK